MSATDFWDRMSTRGPASVLVDGVSIAAGSRVRLRPRSHTDIFDLALSGRTAVVERIEQDDAGGLHVAVTLDDDPGRDLGDALLPGHRFFYALDEVEPLTGEQPAAPGGRILVAGIGNVFLGDDGFGVEVVRRLAGRATAPDVDVVDFGIRGMDLVYALQRPYAAVVFVDTAARGESPGTLTVLEPEPPRDGPAPVQTHAMDPVAALRLAASMGTVPALARVVCCEPRDIPTGAPDEDLVASLSPPVAAAVDEAVRLVEAVITELSGRAGSSGRAELVGQAEPAGHPAAPVAEGGDTA